MTSCSKCNPRALGNVEGSMVRTKPDSEELLMSQNTIKVNGTFLRSKNNNNTNTEQNRLVMYVLGNMDQGC